MWVVFLLLLLLLTMPLSVHAEELGKLSVNPFSHYGSPFSNQSATNHFATDAPRFHARLSGLSGLFGSAGWFAGPANKTDPIDQINESVHRFLPERHDPHKFLPIDTSIA